MIVAYEKMYTLRTQVGLIESSFAENIGTTYSFKYALQALISRLVHDVFTIKSVEIAKEIKEFQGELFKITEVYPLTGRNDVVNSISERLYTRLNIGKVKRLIAPGEPFLLNLYTNFNLPMDVEYKLVPKDSVILVPIIFGVDSCGIADNIDMLLNGESITINKKMPRRNCYPEPGLIVEVEYTQVL